MSGRFDMLEQVLTAIHILNEPQGVTAQQIINFVKDRIDGLFFKRRNEIRKVTLRIRNALDGGHTSRLYGTRCYNASGYPRGLSCGLKHDNIYCTGCKEESFRRKIIRKRRVRQGQNKLNKRFKKANNYDKLNKYLN